MAEGGASLRVEPVAWKPQGGGCAGLSCGAGSIVPEWLGSCRWTRHDPQLVVRTLVKEALGTLTLASALGCVPCCSAVGACSTLM